MTPPKTTEKLDKLHKQLLSENTDNGRYDPPPAFLLDESAMQSRTKDHGKVDRASPLLGLDWDHTDAMSFVSRYRSIRSPEIQLAAEATTTWLNGQRVGSAAVPGSAEYEGWKNTPASRARILQLFEQLKAAKEAASRQVVSPELVRKYPVMSLPSLALTRRTFMPYATAPMPVIDHRTGQIGVRQQPASGRYPFGEVLAAHGLLTLLQGDSLDLLRQCALPDCQRWFFAPRDKSFHCPGEACGQRARDRDPERKALRRASRTKNEPLAKRVRNKAKARERQLA